MKPFLDFNDDLALARGGSLSNRSKDSLIDVIRASLGRKGIRSKAEVRGAASRVNAVIKAMLNRSH
jgi:hypothetical protein